MADAANFLSPIIYKKNQKCFVNLADIGIISQFFLDSMKPKKEEQKFASILNILNWFPSI